MGRFLAGVGSTVLLIAGGFFLWTGLAGRAPSPLPAAPAAPPSALLAGANPVPAGAAPIAAPQATEETREQKRFDRYDHNRDGRIDRDEYLLARRKAFAKLDTNGDGKLSFEEYAVKTSTKFAKADADKSGTLDAAEFATTAIQRKPRPRCAPAAATPPPGANEGGDEG